MIDSTRPLPSWLLTELKRPPQTGRHQWFFRTALKLLRYRDKYVTMDLLESAATRVGRYVPVRELREAVRNAERRIQGGSLRKLQQEGLRWPKPNLDEIDGIVRSEPWHHELWDLSPERVSSEQRHTEAVIDVLYPGNPLLCCGLDSWRFATRRREVWRGRLHTLPLIVPNPMRAVWGRTDDGQGHWSQHALSNTGPRHLLVIEFDFTQVAGDGLTATIWAPLISGWEQVGITVADACAALLIHLSKTAPLVLIVNSGGKSLHGWFPCQGTDERRLQRWMRRAVQLGACQSTWCRSQFVRIPDGTRSRSGHRQAIEYFNPKVL